MFTGFNSTCSLIVGHLYLLFDCFKHCNQSFFPPKNINLAALGLT